jgi:hypothetical protein
MGTSYRTNVALEKTSAVAFPSTVILYCPSASVTVAALPPFTETVTPAAGCLVSAEVTVPVICLVCANSGFWEQHASNSINNPVVLRILIIVQFLKINLMNS